MIYFYIFGFQTKSFLFMKIKTTRINLISIILLLLFSVKGYSQEVEEKIYHHEIRVDLFQLIVLPAIELTYERFIDPQSSWGITVFVNFDNSMDYRNENFEISPFYRLYFQKEAKANQGFFAQAFMSLTQGYYDNHDGGPNLTDTSIGVAAGAIVGTKWVNKKKASFEIHAGVGRFLNFDKGRAYPRINFAIGKRF